MRPGDEEAVDDGSRDSNDFHCSFVFFLLLFHDWDFSMIIINQLSRLLYNEEHAEFVDIPSGALTIFHAEATCYSCDLKTDESDLTKTHQPDDETLIHHGIEYHVYEFVYIHPSRNTNLLDIGQITAIEDDNISVTFLGRYDSFVHQQQKNENDGERDDVLVCDEVMHQFIFAIQVSPTFHRGACFSPTRRASFRLTSSMVYAMCFI
jgi:hypothetical protein